MLALGLRLPFLRRGAGSIAERLQSNRRAGRGAKRDRQIKIQRIDFAIKSIWRAPA